jgi:hypothetical protein
MAESLGFHILVLVKAAAGAEGGERSDNTNKASSLYISRVD